jgi:hypothetical protein
VNPPRIEAKMNRHAMLMKVGRLHLALLLALATVVTPVPRSARADLAPSEMRATEAVWEGSGAGGDAEIDRWWGAAGAVICGAELRLIRVAPAIGMNPYVLAAGIAGCTLAALDIFTTQ